MEITAGNFQEIVLHVWKSRMFHIFYLNQHGDPMQTSDCILAKHCCGTVSTVGKFNMIKPERGRMQRK